jgi:hypothetical protein
MTDITIKFMENKDIKLENSAVLSGEKCATYEDVANVDSTVVDSSLEFKEKIGQTVAFSNDIACQDNMDEIQLSEEEKLFFSNLKARQDYLNQEAVNEYQRIWKKNEVKEREAKSKQFRKKVWEKITSPWQTIKEAVKGVGSFVERIIPSAAMYQDLQSMPGRKQERLHQKYKNDKLDLECLSDLEYEFIEENRRTPQDHFELLNFKGARANDLKRKYDEDWNKIESEKHGYEHAQILNDAINNSAYLRFKQNPGKEISRTWANTKKWYDNSWLNKPVVPSLREFSKAEVSWGNLKEFFSGKESRYTFAKAKVKSSRNVAAAYYNEDNTNSGVVAPIAIKKPKKIEEKSEFGNWMKRSVVAGVFGLLAILGFYHKKNQKTENANTYNQAAMVANNSTADGVKSGEVSEPKKVEVSENDNLENTAESPVAKPEPVAKKAVASHSNVGSQRTHRSVSKPAVAEQKAEPQISEQKTLKSAQELLLEVEEMKLKDSWKTRIANLKAKILNPGYVQPTVPTGFSPYDNGMITSTNIKGIPQEDSYESHIAIVEGIIAKSDLSQEDIENAEKALTSSEDRMKNNILAENQARYVNAFDIHMTSARAKLKGIASESGTTII